MVENKLFEALLDVIPFGAYAVDINTYEIVYANKIMRQNMFAPQEKKCWESMYGQNDICAWCTIKTLKKNKSLNVEQDEKYTNDFFYEHDDKWIKSYSEIIHWPDGRDVKYSILIDITDEKALYGDMIQAHAKMAMVNKHITTTNKNLQITKLKFQKSLNELQTLYSEMKSTIDHTKSALDVIRQADLTEEQLQAVELIESSLRDLFKTVQSTPSLGIK